jgi:hypothetical protein
MCILYLFDGGDTVNQDCIAFEGDNGHGFLAGLFDHSNPEDQFILDPSRRCSTQLWCEVLLDVLYWICVLPDHKEMRVCVGDWCKMTRTVPPPFGRVSPSLPLLPINLSVERGFFFVRVNLQLLVYAIEKDIVLVLDTDRRST